MIIDHDLFIIIYKNPNCENKEMIKSSLNHHLYWNDDEWCLKCYYRSRIDGNRHSRPTGKDVDNEPARFSVVDRIVFHDITYKRTQEKNGGHNIW